MRGSRVSTQLVRTRIIAALFGLVCAVLGLAAAVAGGAEAASPVALKGRGPRDRDCFIEWVVVGAKHPRSPVRCRHGDPSCDSGLTLGACTFQVALCFNDAGASIYEQQCATTRIISVLDAVVDGCSAATSCRLPLQNWMRVRDAILALGASSGPKGGFVFADPLTSIACSAPFDLVVPLRNPGRQLRAGAWRDRITVISNQRLPGTHLLKKDTDHLRLVCLP